MDKFVIHLTEEQTKKALEVGAPVLAQPDALENRTWLKVTAEEMIGWLEEQEEISDLHIFKPITHWTFELYASDGGGQNNHPLFDSRREATLAAIDTALEYLTNNKKSNMKADYIDFEYRIGDIAPHIALNTFIDRMSIGRPDIINIETLPDSSLRLWYFINNKK